jgi:hypothetical protein
MKTQRERQEERRRERLAAVEDQVRRGSLTIRRMTEAERARYPARERRANRRA